MKVLRTLVVLAALIFSATAFAAGVGDDAPSIDVNEWAMNAPESFDGTNLKGRVTFIELWGIN